MTFLFLILLACAGDIDRTALSAEERIAAFNRLARQSDGANAFDDYVEADANVVPIWQLAHEADSARQRDALVRADGDRVFWPPPVVPGLED